MMNPPAINPASRSGGLLYNQLGLFWDGSWFGNLPYLNGHKLDPDMNLEVEYTNDWDIIGVSGMAAR